MAVQIQIRRGLAADWTSANPVLAQGELGIELDTRKFKVGDGLTAWNSLLYVAARPEDLTSEISAAVAQILGDAPAVLDTLGELSDAINDDPNFVSTVTTLSGDFTSHTSATTTVHGIPDTAQLETLTGAQTKATAAETAAKAYTDAELAAATMSLQAYADTAETDAITSANSYTDAEITTATNNLQAYADQAEADAVTSAAADATAKANAAQAAAEATAAADATAKANAAEAAANAYTDGQVSDLIQAAPGALDTLNELAAAINDDENFAATVATNLSNAVTNLEAYADQAEADAVATAAADASTKATAAETAAKAYTDAEIATATTSLQAYADTAESDAVTAANAYTDGEITAATTALQAYADTAESDAVTAAALDATSKANAAQAAAEATAAADATAKANAAETAANTYTDNEVSSAEARMEVYSAPALQFAADGSVLANLPAQVPSAERLLKQAVWWIDAAHSSASGQSVSNLGFGGSVLDARLGSASGADSNDPKFLDWDGENYVYLPGTTSDRLTVADEAALDLISDMTLVARVACDDWTPSASAAVLGKYGASGTRSFALRVNTDGTLRFGWTTDGATSVAQDSTVATGFTDGTAHWIKVTLDVDNGSSAYEVKFYTADDSSNVPSLWSQLGSTKTGGSTTSVFSGSSVFSIGYNDIGSTGIAAKVYSAQVLNGIDGPTVLDIDCSQIGSGSDTSFTALTGQTVTINRSTSGRKSVAVTHPCWLFGTDDYMEVADNDLIDFGASDSFTVLAVVRQWATQPFMALISKGDADVPIMLGWFLATNAATANLKLGDGAASAYHSTVTHPYQSLGVVSMTIDRVAARATTIVNGVSGSAIAITYGSLANTLPLRVGRTSNGGTTGYFAGEFVAAAIFRRALTAGEITTLTNYFTGRIA